MEVLNSSSVTENSIVFNTANEVAVNAFLNSQIGFLEIVKVVQLTLENFTANDNINVNSLSDIMSIDHKSRTIAKEVIEGIYAIDN